MSFYRIYRPQTIEEIDNEYVRDTLNSLQKKKITELPHAFLFTGPRGTGKTTAGRVLAKLFNCSRQDSKTKPCGTCESCRAISEGRHMDVLELDAASNRGIDEIRTIRDGIALAPVMGSFKVYIIDEVHMLTTEAFNALLKTLEEPPLHAVFILATTDPQKLPKTIISRCVHVSFREAKTAEMHHALKRIIQTEKIDIEEDAVQLLIRLGEGSFRDTVKYLEQVSFKKGKITLDDIENTLSVSSEQKITEFLKALSDRDIQKSINSLIQLSETGTDFKVFTADILRVLHRDLLDSARGTYKGVLTMSDVKELIRRFTRAYSDIKTSVIPQLPLELEVTEFCLSSQSELSAAPQEAALDEPKTQTGTKQPDTRTDVQPALGMLTTDRLLEYWKDVIDECKPLNHSIAGVLRSSRPKIVGHGIVTIEAFYKFHQEKLSESKSKELLSSLIKKLFGETVKVEIVLGKK